MTTPSNGANYCDNLPPTVANASFPLPKDYLSLQNEGTKVSTNSDTLRSPHANDRTFSSTAIDKKRGVFRFETDWLISNISWSNDDTYKLALTSYIEQYTNFIQLVKLDKDESDQDIKSICKFEHPYPATKILWEPQKSSISSQLLATTADYLRLWRFDESDNADASSGPTQSNKRVHLESLLNGNLAPLTSFDWTDDSSLIVTSSYDSTCNIWDISVGKIISSLNGPNQRGSLKGTATEQHVYDIAWCHQASGKDEIVLCQNNSIRLCDLRNPCNPVILYETDSHTRTSDRRGALVRVGCSRQDTNLVATFAENSGKLFVIDLRKAGHSLCVLDHPESVNAISWSPKSSRGICSGDDDNQALIWQVSSSTAQSDEPLLAYRADGKINAVSWAPSNVFIAIGYRNILEFLRV